MVPRYRVRSVARSCRRACHPGAVFGVTDEPSSADGEDEPRRPSPKVRGDQMSGADQWAWAMRLLRHAASAVSAYGPGTTVFDSLSALLDELDEEAVRGVAVHLAFAPRRIGAIAFSAEGLDDLAVRLAWVWSE